MAQTTRKARRLAWIVALVTLALGAAFIRLVEQRREDTKRRAARDAASALARRLEQELDAPLSVAEVLASVLRQAGRIDRLGALAQDLIRARPSIESLQLAPDGVVTEVVPSEAAGAALGRDLLRDPEVQSFAREAAGAKRAVLTGPLPRADRGPVLLGLWPVFLPSESGDERLWGFVAVAIGLRPLLQAASADAVVAQGYDYELEASAASGQRRRVLARTTERGLAEPVTAQVQAAASPWTVRVAPRSGWRSAPVVAAEIVLVLVAALIAALSAHRLAREPETLLQEVEVRRRRLSEANRQLHVEVAQRLEAEERLRHDAAHDSLTSLPNRASFLGQVQAALDFTRDRPELKIAVLLADMDRFKYVNDSLGHSVGDRLLLEVAARIQKCLRPGDAIARVGGDEFAVLLCDVDSPQAVTRVADRLLREMQLPFSLEPQDVFSTVSIGIVLSAPGYSKAEELLRDADTAMHRGKLEGRARYVSFDEGMRTRVVTLLQLETDLRRAIEREEFRVHYQPIVSLGKGTVSGCEALVRWQHPARGLVYPMEFMPLAEETGLVIWIDRWVLGEASRLLRTWQQRLSRGAPLFVSVNLSGKQLAQPRLVDFVASTLRETELDFSSLKLEITESAVMENADMAREVLGRLRQMGVRLSIDDFGTGYSSLGYLDRFPFHTVKIDQSFVRGRKLRDKDAEIVRSIVELAHNLGMDVVAEGVETEEQLQGLREVSCGFGQGYLFAKPLAAEEFERLIAANPQW